MYGVDVRLLENILEYSDSLLIAAREKEKRRAGKEELNKALESYNKLLDATLNVCRRKGTSH